MDDGPERETFNPASKMEGVSQRQAEEIKSQSRPNAALIHETIRADGESELDRGWWAILLSGLAAGLSIALSLIVQGEFHAFISDSSIGRLVAPLGYSVGFLVVVMGRQQLFTENTLAPILPLLHHRDRGTLLSVVRLWVLVLVSNVADTWLAASALAHTDVFEPNVRDAFGNRPAHGCRQLLDDFLPRCPRRLADRAHDVAVARRQGFARSYHRRDDLCAGPGRILAHHRRIR
jgi:formate-nitrite transporter family protein